MCKLETTGAVLCLKKKLPHRSCRKPFHKILCSQLFIPLFSDLRLGVSDKLVNSTAANPISRFLTPFTNPLLQKSISSLLSRNGVNCSTSTHYSIPKIKVRLPEISIPERRIQELIFPFHLPTNINAIIGDQDCNELTVGDDVSDTPTVAFSSILKKRHKKMNKHKFQKRRKRDVFKRRHLENLKLRKKRTKERKEQLRQAQD